jgi:hypothetical protein
MIAKRRGLTHDDASKLLFSVTGYPYQSPGRAVLFCDIALEQGGGTVAGAIAWFRERHAAIMAEDGYPK